MNRYRKPGWYGESHRHYLAAKGVKTRRYYAYAPTYTGADLPLIATDAVGTVGAEAVSLAPVVVPVAMLYGGVKLAKKAKEKSEKRKSLFAEKDEEMISFTPEELERFDKELQRAKNAGEETFWFKGHPVFVKYGEYLSEYLHDRYGTKRKEYFLPKIKVVEDYAYERPVELLKEQPEDVPQEEVDKVLGREEAKRAVQENIYTPRTDAVIGKFKEAKVPLTEEQIEVLRLAEQLGPKQFDDQVTLIEQQLIPVQGIRKEQFVEPGKGVLTSRGELRKKLPVLTRERLVTRGAGQQIKYIPLGTEKSGELLKRQELLKKVRERGD